ncbi:MAG TPA: glycosyltransferase family 4 protein, partial [Opitutaceae bacterium]|nr:glycosyltransferase family 4 protein [Opitutaceae bacterium]
FPAPPSGGAIVIYRHLRRLVQEGWRVTVAAPAPAFRPVPEGHGFELRALPRKKWWPPARPEWPLTQWLRARMWTNAMRSDPTWVEPTPDVILTVLWGHTSLTAAQLARVWRVPLAVIVHDLFRETALPPRLVRDGEKIMRAVLREATRVWPVSDEMSGQLTPLCPPGTVRTLTPVPEQNVAPAGGWPVRFRTAPVIAHAGAFHAHHVEYLAAVARSVAKFGGSLLVLTPADNPVLAQLQATGVAFRHQPSFVSSAEALSFLAAEASAFTLMYPLNPKFYRHPPTGFPSRLIEFSRLGLPILIAAPANNPVNNWARRHTWPLLLDRADWTELDSLVAQLADATKWSALSARMRAIATNACDPEKIHRQFLAELPRAHP